MIKSASAHDGCGAVAVEREKPNSGHMVVMNIGADIQLVRRIEARDGRQIWRKRANVPHRKWDDSNPRTAVESIDFQFFGNQRLQLGFFNSPMHKKEFAPLLMHHRLALGPLPNRKPL